MWGKRVTKEKENNVIVTCQFGRLTETQPIFKHSTTSYFVNMSTSKPLDSTTGVDQQGGKGVDQQATAVASKQTSFQVSV